MPKNKSILRRAVIRLLDMCYRISLNGLGIFQSASALAKKYLRQNGNNARKASRDLIKKQTRQSALFGSVTSIGGIITIPFNIISVLCIQIRLSSAIAYLQGYDLRDKKVKSFIYLTFLGKSRANIIRKSGFKIGNKLTGSTITQMGRSAFAQLNQLLELQMLANVGEQSLINFGKLIPIVGAVIAGIFDFITTRKIGRNAMKVF